MWFGGLDFFLAFIPTLGSFLVSGSVWFFETFPSLVSLFWASTDKNKSLICLTFQRKTKFREDESIGAIDLILKMLLLFYKWKAVKLNRNGQRRPLWRKQNWTVMGSTQSPVQVIPEVTALQRYLAPANSFDLSCNSPWYCIVFFRNGRLSKLTRRRRQSLQILQGN